MSDFAAAYSAMSPGLMTMMNNKKKPQMQPHRQQNHPPVMPYGGMYAYQMVSQLKSIWNPRYIDFPLNI